MDLVRNVGDLAITAVDEFENVLFQAATAETNGFRSIWRMYGKMVVVAAASGWMVVPSGTFPPGYGIHATTRGE